ncbi:MAG: HAMP domain-containing protein [Candidatus Wallbacteria bacterium]|nr:HAMP domain-containing protein [Candidatus Wallbacteria bacterium]
MTESRLWHRLHLLGLEGRAVLAASSILVAVVAILVTMSYAQATYLLRRVTEARLESLGRTLADTLDFAVLVGNREAIEQTISKLMAHDPLVYCVVEDAHGKLLLHKRAPRYFGPIPESCTAPPRFSATILERIDIVTSPALDDPEDAVLAEVPRQQGTKDIGRIRLGLSCEDLQAEVEHARFRAGATALWIVVLVYLLTRMLMRKLTSPLREMEHFAERVAAGDLSHAAPTVGAGEIGSLATSLERMVHSLAASREEIARYNRELEDKVRDRTRELEQAHDLTRRVLDEIPLGLVVTGADQVVQYHNPAFEELFGKTGPRLLEGIDGVLEPSVSAIRAWPLAEGQGLESLPLEAMWAPRDRRAMVLEMRRATIMPDPSTSHVWIFHDVTEQREIHRKVAQAGRLAALGELAAGVAHEVNNPADGIMGISRIVRQRSEGDARLVKDMRMVEDCARRISAIAQNLLLFSRQEQTQFQPQGIVEGIRRTVSLIQRQLELRRQVTVECYLPPDLPQVRVRGNQLEQIWLNLMNNSAQALDELPPDRPRRIHVSARAVDDGSAVEVSVSDTGPGIPPALLDRIFEPFFTTKGRLKGTGLGLSISYGIARDHGGDITVRSVQDEGTTFVVRLPAATGQVP